MKSLLLTLTALALISCGKANVHVDPELQPYLNHFLNVADYEGYPRPDLSSLSAYFEDLGPRVLGDCESAPGDDMRTIRISTNSWPKMPELSREELMLHELGHCILNRPHESRLLTGSVPYSIMWPAGIDYSVYQSNRLHYWHELFWRD